MWSWLNQFACPFIRCGVAWATAVALCGCAFYARPAPELTGTTALNAAQPVTLARLKGKVVVLDFWSYSCVNCLKTIEAVKQLQGQLKDDVIFIGVHSPKYDSEKSDRSVRSAMKRFGIDHLVLNDPNSVAWKNYAIDVWPTFVVIDTTGHIVHQFTGDRCLPALGDALTALVKKERDRGALTDAKLAFLAPTDDTDSARIVNAPGKVAADAARNQLFVSSTGGNKIIAIHINNDGVDQSIQIGDGSPGLRNGTYEHSRFNHPEGIAVDGNRVYVADADNHAIRMIDLDKRTVSTVVGDGTARNTNDDTKLLACHAKLDSPWDIIALKGKLYIAMAGAHQIWCLEPDANCIHRVAGSGNEALTDGQGVAAALAQPSGLATDGQLIYFADSESNSVRTLDPATGQVSTLAGKAMNICGDKDGCCADALFSHPEGLTVRGKQLYVADSFNNKVRRIDLEKRNASTLAGTGEAGGQDGEFATFSEPSGLAILGGKLYVADRANDGIRVVDLRSGGTSTLDLAGAAQAPPLRNTAAQAPPLTEVPVHGKDSHR